MSVENRILVAREANGSVLEKPRVAPNGGLVLDTTKQKVPLENAVNGSENGPQGENFIFRIPSGEILAGSYKNGMSVSEIGRFWGLSDPVVSLRLKREGVPMRSRGEAQKLAWTGEEKRKNRLERTQSPEAKDKRRKSIKAYFEGEEGKEALKRLFQANKKDAISKRKTRIKEVREKLGFSSNRPNRQFKASLRAKLDELGSLHNARAFFNEKGADMGIMFFRSVLKYFDIVVVKHKRGAIIDREKVEIVSAGRKKEFLENYP